METTSKDSIRSGSSSEENSAGLGFDGIPALDLLDLIVAVLGNTNHNHDRTGRPVDKQT